MTNRMLPRTIACALFSSTALCGLISQPASAQQYQPQQFRQLDANGVDVTWGDYVMNFVEGSIGTGEGKLELVRNAQWRDGAYDGNSNNLNWDRISLSYVTAPTSTTGTHINVNIGSRFETFTGPGTLASGSTLTGGGSSYSYRTADGTIIQFADPTSSAASSSQYCNGTQSQCELLPVSITTPDGRTTNISWDVNTYTLTSGGGGGGQVCAPDDFSCVGGTNTSVSYDTRIREVSNSFGYRIAFTYASNVGGTTTPSDVSWHKRTRADFYNDNRSSSPVSSVSYAYPSTGVTQVTDTGGRVWQFTGTGDRVSGIRRPGAATDTTTIGYNASGLVSSVTREGVTTNYNRSVSGSTITMTVTNPLNQATVITSDANIGRPTSVTDPLSHTTGYQYDAYGRLTRTTLPEGNYMQLTYDARGNVTETRRVAKAGSGLADIVTSASYDATCSNPVTCNEPNTTTDAKNNVTNYNYDPTHGGVLTVTSPAAASGVRPQIRYTYESAAPYRLTDISQCQTAASCANTSDEVRTSVTYDTNSNVATVTKKAGDNSVSSISTMTYTVYGDLETVDGPLAGSGDTTKYRYSNARELVGVTEPDPDGAGPLKMRATRRTYTNALLTKVELGTANSLTDADWTAFSPVNAVDIGYDANARPAWQKLSAAGTDYALTQFSYDALGRSDCTAVRMNTAAYASLPASACTLGAQGAFGPDRISKTIYDAAGQVTQARVAVGTSDEAAERTLVYTNNGVVGSVIDGENNRTDTYHDGFDRLGVIYYPSATKGAGTSNSNDTDQFAYDANGNVTAYRTRKGDLFNYTYDNLNRMTLKVTPGSERNVAYSYDLPGHLLSATFQYKGISGPIQSVTNTFDALGRLTSSTSNMDGVNRTVTSSYDPAGNRTRVAVNVSGYGADISYDNLSRMTATAGLGIGYDNLGRRSSLSFTYSGATNSTAAFGYDAIGRLSSLTHDLAGTAADQTFNFSYNPASQIASRAASNDSYAYTGSVNVNRGYTSNGLNQYTAAGSASFTYDANGNMTSDGSNTFVYDSENRLTSVSGAHTASLAYDPLGRLWQISASSGTTNFIYDGDHDIVETDGSGNWKQEFIWGPGANEPLLQWDGAGPKMLHADERGSIISIADTNGNLTQTNSYDEYGTPGSGNQGRFQYTGQAWLNEIGLYYYKARMYSPTAGRFLQTDPIGYGDGLNWYAYVHDDPVNHSDPRGLDCVTVLTPCPIVGQGDVTVIGFAPFVGLIGGSGGGGGGNRDNERILHLEFPIQGGDEGSSGFSELSVSQIPNSTPTPAYCSSTLYKIGSAINSLGNGIGYLGAGFDAAAAGSFVGSGGVATPGSVGLAGVGVSAGILGSAVGVVGNGVKFFAGDQSGGISSVISGLAAGLPLGSSSAKEKFAESVAGFLSDRAYDAAFRSPCD